MSTSAKQKQKQHQLQLQQQQQQLQQLQAQQQQQQQIDLFGMMSTQFQPPPQGPQQIVQAGKMSVPGQVQMAGQPQFAGPMQQQIAAQIIQTPNGPQLVPQGAAMAQLQTPGQGPVSVPPPQQQRQRQQQQVQSQQDAMISPTLTTAQQLNQRRHSSMMTPANTVMLSPHPVIKTSRGGSSAPTPRPHSSQAQIVVPHPHPSHPGSAQQTPNVGGVAKVVTSQQQQMHHPATPRINTQISAQWAQMQNSAGGLGATSMSAASSSAMQGPPGLPNGNFSKQQLVQMQQLQQLQATYATTC
ncbi:unnamed protein product [Ambrosiozyma monospora]|uniref:Unnamed protein product n=1 Tax=Ambrosiozyma monospora TaxID=43982 RepID=A0A9W6Z6D9_AMBMO|nr:unnamed protein product [Ambrosiozyma monospora]